MDSTATLRIEARLLKRKERREKLSDVQYFIEKFVASGRLADLRRVLDSATAVVAEAEK